MYIDPPVWQLKRECPICSQRSLILCTCENCQKVIAICDEDETIFYNPFDISLDTISDKGNDTCPHCSTIGKIRPSKDMELIQIGLPINDYE